MDFNEFDLHPGLQQGIADMGYVSCMPVQEQVLASAFGGQDLYVQSQTGTGKTAAYLIVIFQRLLAEPLLTGKKAIIMVPTRELAVQVEQEAIQLGKHLPFKVGSFYGGVGYAQQQQSLRDNAQILVGTPGRVLDLNSSGYMNLMDIAFLILDEADRMFDMGFYPDLRKLIKVVPPADRRQTMLFSATLNAWVKNLAWEYTKSPLEIEIAPETVTVEEIEQVLYHVPSANKLRLLLGILDREKPESAIIFCNTKRYTEIVAKRLNINGIGCEFIIGDLPQSKRLKIIEDVKAGKIHFLVATDVAARGLDIEGLSMVVNFDLPSEAENYVHRIGRTARAGKTGKAISLASEQDVYELPAIERYIGKKIPSATADESLYGEDKSRGQRIHTDIYDDRRGGHSGSRREGGRFGGSHSEGGGHFGGSRSEGGRRESGPAGGHTGGRFSGPRPEGSFGGSQRNGLAGERPGPGRRRDRRPQEAGYVREKASGAISGQETAPEVSGQLPSELINLSLEERMVYYKQKYTGPATGKSQGPRDPEGGREPSAQGANEKDREQKPRDRQDRGNRRDKRRKDRQSGTAYPGGDAGNKSRPGQPTAAGKDAVSGAANKGRSGKPAAAGKGTRAGSVNNRPGQPTAVGKAAESGTAKKGLLGRILGIFKKSE
jgi:ATP-dependent RNA helicase RhlB